MKKFLSMVLALVMVMSLVTVSAGAKDFTDNSKINYKEAVDVMSAVGVIDGYEDGSFNPQGTLTRGAAAKIICNLILGPTTASALSADTAPYKDVPVNHTFAGYIAYCQQQGIISGYADGTFRPAATLTNYAFMKMLLGALGYDSNIEGYVGDNWSIQVAKRALAIGLDDGLVDEFVGTQAATREQACLYALNTMTADMVEYEAKTSVSVSGVEVSIAGSAAKTMANTSKTDGNVFSADDEMQFAEKYFTNLSVRKGQDDFARPSNVWKLKAEEIGTYADEADATYTASVKSNQIYKDLGLGSTIAKSDVTVYVNGEEAEDAALAIKKGSEEKVGSGLANSTAANGVLTQVYYDDVDDSVIITQVITYVGEIAKTVKATSTRDTYVVIDKKTNATTGGNYFETPKDIDGNPAGTLEFETEESFDDDTYVLYTYSFSADEVKSVVPAEKVEGYVSKTINKTQDDDKNNGMTIDGTAYKMSLANAGESLSNVSVKKDYTVYLDEYGYIIYVEEIEEIGDYALLLATASRGSFIGNKAQLLLTDGTIKFVDTDENYHSGSKAIADNTIVTFREDSDGEYTLKAVTSNGGTQTNATNQTTFSMTNDKAAVVIETVSGVKDTVNTNSATVFVVSDKNDYNANYAEIDDWTAYTGIKNAPTVTAGAGTNEDVTVFYYCKNAGMATVMFIIPNKAATVKDDNHDMIFLAAGSVSDLIHDEDGNYYEYEAVVNGEIQTVKVDEDTVVAGKVAYKLGGLYSNYSTNKYGIITDLETYNAYDGGTYDGDDACVIQGGTGIAKTSKEYTVTLNTTTGTKSTWTVDDNAKIYYVDTSDKISEISYADIAVDDNDEVYAVIEDYMVQTLVIYGKKAPTVSYGVAVTTDANATVKVNGKTVASGKTMEFEKNDEDVVITVTPADGYQVKTVKVDGVAVDLDAKNQYTISKIKTLHTVDVVTEAIPEAPMTVTVRYILQGSTAELADSLTEEITADKTYTAATIAGYTATEATKTVTFAAGKSQTVTFFYTKDADATATHNVIVNKSGAAAAAVTADGVTDVAENTTATVEIVLDTTAYTDATVEVTVGGVSYGTYTVTGTQSVSVPVGTADVVVNINVTAATPV